MVSLMEVANESGLQPDEARSSEPLFGSVSFSIIRSKGLPEAKADELTELLKTHGGTHVPVNPATGKVPLNEVTHLISSTADFPDYGPAMDELIPVVRPEWVTTSLSKRRLAQLRPYSPDPRLFFAGVTVCCADLPPGDKDAIIGGVIAMGGQYTGHLTKLVTHIVALTEHNEKCQQAISKKLRCTIVLPHWFDDCLKLGRRIDERPYKLPNPEITRLDSTDPVQLPSDGHLKGASSPRPGQLPTPNSPSSHRSDLNVFRGKRIMLSSDLGLGSRLRGTIEDLIVSGGGSVTGSVHKAHLYICQYREGEEYKTASRAGKDVGNLPWLYYLIAYNAWTSPLRRLLHYPVARGGLPGFRNYRISLSNYGGEARLYLENLVVAAGGEFTKTLRQDNTHLITARPHSEKCQAAREWNIHMVNHLWLEESYARWEEQSLTNPRYTHFPARTNLGEVVGQTQMDRHALESAFFPAEDNEMSEDEQASKAVRPPRPSRKAEEEVDDHAVKQPPSVGKFQKENKGPLTPMASRLSIDGRTDQTPSTTGSRSAKERAMAKLHDLAPDIALYEKERKRVGGVTHGGRRSNSEAAPTGGKRRSVSHPSDSEEESADEEEGESRARKRAKKSSKPSPSIRLLLTSYRPWVGELKKEEEEKRRLRDLGILIVQDPSDCTHLAAPTMIRTQKFVAALAYAPAVLSSEFVDYCLEKGEIGPEEKFLLKDLQTERRLGIRLKDALKNARANERRLLKGISIYCTPNVHGGVETYKAIVEANGGRCMPFRARHGAVSSETTAVEKHEHSHRAEAQDDQARKYMYLLSNDGRDERKLWPKFRQMARENQLLPRIVKTEWLLDVAMSQELKWQDDYEWDTSEPAAQ